MNSELATTFLGIELKSPVIAGSCPLTIEPEMVRQLACAGVGAIVLPSILQEQILYATIRSVDPEHAIERSGYQPLQDRYNGGVDNYLAAIRQLKLCEQIPIFASISGSSVEHWIDYAKEIQAAGADALQLSWPPIISLPEESSDQVEQHFVDTVRRLCENISIPVAVKLHKRFTNLASIAKKLQNAGADGLILFTHLPEWDVHIDQMRWTIRWELSPVHSLGGTLEGIVHARAGELDISIAASGGVRSAEDAIKAMIAGANAVMVTSEIYREGPEVVHKMIDGISRFLDNSPYKSLLDFLQARPNVEFGPLRMMQLEYSDPLTHINDYVDPTPVASFETGDCYGHKA
ncbi:Dihydroorotate dehydrogenase B (NAD(+)), catalytic subunit [Planctomycetes bacterium CA13]|uniref:Dihydroorotate dehydrogenase B (NAD(+)), catalytic subunit n=1 Tax=Novipirellula herctigrandis TaxID=2527986 RepID=A0A5C5YX46_9BACT|nr:Dihydroorotate dehydrogenase B (NAD(+)), catalytic subunit [Planctomycetes bacterium CA13]